MRIGIFKFSPGLTISLLMLVALSILLNLGFWQLRRVDEKQLVLDQQELKKNLPVVNLTKDISEFEDLLYREVVIEGQFIPEFIVYLDNKILNGRVGYNHVALFKITGSDKYVFINRGWITQQGSRQQLPELSLPAGTVKITGKVKLDTEDVASFGSGNRVREGWPAVVRWLDIEVLKDEIGLDVLPLLVLENPDKHSIYIREWSFITSTPEKSMSYAVQWFSMALVLIIIFIVLNTKRVERKQD